MEAEGSSVLAQRAASEGPRWTRAMEDPSAPIPEEISGKLGWIIDARNGRPSRLDLEDGDRRAVGLPGRRHPLKRNVRSRRGGKVK